MQRTLTERNLNLIGLPADVQKYMMQYLSPADLMRLHAANRHFKTMVEQYLDKNPTIKETIYTFQSRNQHLLFTIKTDQLNDYIEDEQDHLPTHPIRHITLSIIGAVACVSIGLMTSDLTILRNTLLAVGAFLLALAAVIGVRYAIIDRRINNAYHEINQLNHMEAGRLPRLR
jgi:hypothetical protein